MNPFNHLTAAALSDQGLKRKNNEDAFGLFPSHGIFCVADGMGGAEDGEVASSATVRAVETFTVQHPMPKKEMAYEVDSLAAGISSALNEASSWICKRSKERRLKGSGSTFVGVCFDAAKPESALALHAGDSRLYRLRGRSLTQITRDHSAAEMIGVKSEKDLNPMFRGMVMRAVGIQPSVEVERTPLSVKEGDILLICSDGLTRMVPDKKIQSILREATDLQAAARQLIQAANQAGGVDNITVVLVHIGVLPKGIPVIPIQLSGKTAGAAVARGDKRSDTTTEGMTETQRTKSATGREGEAATSAGMSFEETTEEERTTDPRESEGSPQTMATLGTVENVGFAETEAAEIRKTEQSVTAVPLDVPSTGEPAADGRPANGRVQSLGIALCAVLLLAVLGGLFIFWGGRNQKSEAITRLTNQAALAADRVCAAYTNDVSEDALALEKSWRHVYTNLPPELLAILGYQMQAAAQVAERQAGASAEEIGTLFGQDFLQATAREADWLKRWTGKVGEPFMKQTAHVLAEARERVASVATRAIDELCKANEKADLSAFQQARDQWIARYRGKMPVLLFAVATNRLERFEREIKNRLVSEERQKMEIIRAEAGEAADTVCLAFTNGAPAQALDLQAAWMEKFVAQLELADRERFAARIKEAASRAKDLAEVHAQKVCETFTCRGFEAGREEQEGWKRNWNGKLDAVSMTADIEKMNVARKERRDAEQKAKATREAAEAAAKEVCGIFEKQGWDPGHRACAEWNTRWAKAVEPEVFSNIMQVITYAEANAPVAIEMMHGEKSSVTALLDHEAVVPGHVSLVKPGNHSIVFSRNGYWDLTNQFIVAARQAKHVIPLPEEKMWKRKEPVVIVKDAPKKTGPIGKPAPKSSKGKKWRDIACETFGYLDEQDLGSYLQGVLNNFSLACQDGYELTSDDKKIILSCHEKIQKFASLCERLPDVQPQVKASIKENENYFQALKAKF